MGMYMITCTCNSAPLKKKFSCGGHRKCNWIWLHYLHSTLSVRLTQYTQTRLYRPVSVLYGFQLFLLCFVVFEELGMKHSNGRPASYLYPGCGVCPGSENIKLPISVFYIRKALNEQWRHFLACVCVWLACADLALIVLFGHSWPCVLTCTVCIVLMGVCAMLWSGSQFRVGTVHFAQRLE